MEAIHDGGHSRAWLYLDRNNSDPNYILTFLSISGAADR